VKKLFIDWLRSCQPDLVPLYEELYARGAYAPLHERRRLAALVRRDPERTWPSRFRESSRETEVTERVEAGEIGEARPLSARVAGAGA